MNPQAEEMVLRMAEQIEAAIDDELDRVDHMGEDEVAAIRKNRLKQLQDMQKRKDIWVRHGHGEYRIITDPKDFFTHMKQSERVICHFGRRTTDRCLVMERHLKDLAATHFETLFMYVDVEKHPHLAEKFNVMMLPHIMLVEKENTFHSIIGFDEFGGNDNFSTEHVEGVLCHFGMLNDRDMFAADQNGDDE